jgi:hypothetical protein
MSYTVHATITFHIPVETLPPDIPGSPATGTSDAELPVDGAEQICYEFLAKIQQLLPEGVYPMLQATSYTKAERTPF